MTKKAIAALLLLSGAASRVVAQGDNEHTRPSLGGLPGVWVVVEDLGEDIERVGLSKTQLQTDVELKLRQSGVPVLTREQANAAPGGPTLYISVNAMDIATNFYVFHAHLELYQFVGLLRAPSIVEAGATWSARGGLASVTRDHFIETVRQKVKDMTDEFINAFLAANPKR